jgi:hypothetical protein
MVPSLPRLVPYQVSPPPFGALHAENLKLGATLPKGVSEAAGASSLLGQLIYDLIISLFGDKTKNQFKIIMKTKIHSGVWAKTLISSRGW